MTEHALTLTQETPRSAGHTLRTPYDTTVPARGKYVIRTDLQIELPGGCYGRIAPIKNLAKFQHISTGAGVIDTDFLGNLNLVLSNNSNYPYNISRGDKIATIISEKIYYPELYLLGNLDDTNRRVARGFGSTGQN